MAEKLKICSGCGKRIPFNSECECVIKRRREYDKKRKKNNKEIKSYKWQKLRERIIKRDGGYCQRCFVKYGIINTSDLTAHHIKSREHYPELTYDETNIITLCMQCNNVLGVSDKIDFKFEMKDDNWEVY